MPVERVTDALLEIILDRYHDLGPTYAMATEIKERRAAAKAACDPVAWRYKFKDRAAIDAFLASERIEWPETLGGAVYEAVKQL